MIGKVWIITQFWNSPFLLSLDSLVEFLAESVLLGQGYSLDEMIGLVLVVVVIWGCPELFSCIGDASFGNGGGSSPARSRQHQLLVLLFHQFRQTAALLLVIHVIKRTRTTAAAVKGRCGRLETAKGKQIRDVTSLDETYENRHHPKNW